MDAVASGPDVPFSYDEALMTPSNVDADKRLSNVDENGSGLENAKIGEERKNDSNAGRTKKTDFKIREENDRIRQRFFQKIDQVYNLLFFMISFEVKRINDDEI
jgi:hypothetical protein